MILLCIVGLMVSIVGLMSVLYIKQRELTTGQLVLGSARPRFDRFFKGVLFWIGRAIPMLARVWSAHAFRLFAALLHRTSAAVVIYIEHLLARMLAHVRHRTDVQHASSGEASDFLRAVAEHKKALIAQRINEE